ncbi:MAG: sigma-70 family RNA polymerase sigma factor [Planctomycetota bacterium]|nr:sigma-70 family RNA polymerase sigma factor [Planctomycetota bacterium]
MAYERAAAVSGVNTPVARGVARDVNPEGVWLEQALEGDTEAFGRLVTQYERPVYAYLVSRTHDQELAQEMTQEAFVRAFEFLDRFNRDQRFLQWILGIAHHVLSETRRRKDRQVRGLQEAFDSGRLRGEVQDTEAAHDELPVQERILRAISECPEHYRLPLILRYLHRMNFEEIAEQLLLSQGQVKGVLYRGKQMLREKLSDLFAG